MRLVLRFEFYTDDELTTVLRHRAKCLRWEIHDELPPLIARKSTRNTTDCLAFAAKLLSGLPIAGGDHNHDGASSACVFARTNRRVGLGPVEQQYLSILGAGPQRVNVVASLLGLPSRTISHVVEPFLLRAGLVIKDDQGRRQLTLAGHEHLSKSNPTTV